MPETGNNFKARGRPLIGITTDVVEAAEGRLKVDCSLAYATCVEQAGGVPIMLPPIPSQLADHVRLCDGFILTGGDDPRMEPFGVPTHPKAKVIHPKRQEYELALLDALKGERPQTPVLGVCLGMQLMALHAGGKLNQYLPETLARHALHKNAEHRIIPERGAGFIGSGVVWSNHRQAVDDPGPLRVMARSEDKLIEAVSDPSRPWYVGVQWHPERTQDEVLGRRVFSSLTDACHP